jgi:hypothetical protein
MKTALFLCILTGAMLVLVGCADQTSADVPGTGANRGTIYGVSGSLGGGGGGPTNQVGVKNLP